MSAVASTPPGDEDEMFAGGFGWDLYPLVTRNTANVKSFTRDIRLKLRTRAFSWRWVSQMSISPSCRRASFLFLSYDNYIYGTQVYE
ncbi:LOW QUALITY PROTEIN: hypothetical protein BC938DRAFT_477244 [Jimgerdemannia flammicorona]|uniref:Uncharacterized protein n=1 Tax=Jimgerdemannia flammicorona TaxID=994334 RepID=A0A433QPL5_9FUNG|nr:LOW QUALITY PROTEIN: hypothetical protein BC938DRAFT_477244 [Jimgerdemannia flammicorona]